MTSNVPTPNDAHHWSPSAVAARLSRYFCAVEAADAAYHLIELDPEMPLAPRALAREMGLEVERVPCGLLLDACELLHTEDDDGDGRLVLRVRHHSIDRGCALGCALWVLSALKLGEEHAPEVAAELTARHVRARELAAYARPGVH